MNITKKHYKKYSITITILLLSLITLYHTGTPATATSNPTIKIIDAQTGSSNTGLGSDTEPMPPGGYPFTVNVVLEGLTESLFTYQIALKFDNTKIRCTDAWIPADNPNFVFFGKKIVKGVPDIQKANLDGYVYMGAALLNVKEPVDISTGIFCKITFTAIKTSFSTLEIIPTGGLTLPTEKSHCLDDSFLWDNNMRNIPFTSQGFSINVSASPSPPSASFTFTPINPTSNQQTTFDASASFDPDGYIAGYVWDFADGTTESTSVAVATHMFAENGVYNVKLTLYDDDGLSSSVAHDVLVGQLPFVTFTRDPAESWPYSGDTVTFDASESYDSDGYIETYAWDFGDDTTESTSVAVTTHIFAENGVYNIKLTAFDNEGLYISTAQIIFVGIPPIADFTFSPENPDPNEEVIFNAYGDDTNRFSYDPDGKIVHAIWDFGDLEIVGMDISNPTELIVTHTYAIQGGIYTVKLTVFDDDGLYTTVTRDINVRTIHKPKPAGIAWEGFATVGIVFGVLIAAAIRYKRKPEEKVAISDHRVF